VYGKTIGFTDGTVLLSPALRRERDHYPSVRLTAACEWMYPGTRSPSPLEWGWSGVEEKEMATKVLELEPVAKQKILARLRSVEGHIGGIVRMVGEDAYCVDVIKQTKAVQGAIDRINALLLKRHLNHCVSTAIRSDDTRERERVIREMLDVFEHGGSQRVAGGR
jgi:DNA-binding FrmR family transcriptional regulator